MALADWEQIPDRALKSAVTILHRVAFVFKSPAMLYHVSLRTARGPVERHHRRVGLSLRGRRLALAKCPSPKWSQPSRSAEDVAAAV